MRFFLELTLMCLKPARSLDDTTTSVVCPKGFSKVLALEVRMSDNFKSSVVVCITICFFFAEKMYQNICQALHGASSFHSGGATRCFLPSSKACKIMSSNLPLNWLSLPVSQRFSRKIEKQVSLLSCIQFDVCA